MRKTTLLTLALSSLLVLPAMALGEVWDDFKYYAEDLQRYLSENVKDNFVSSALQYSSKQLNIPDPVFAGKQVRDEIISYSVSNKFENNPAVNGAGGSNEINRVVTRSAVSGVMGERGQLRLKVKLQDIDASLQAIEAAVQDANKSDLITQITDDVCQLTQTTDPNTRVLTENLKNAGLCQTNIQLQTLKILQEQAKINAETFGQTVQTNQALQYSNLNLATISQQVEQTNRARRVDSSAEAARLLRTTSQIDLFGRDPKK